MNDLISSEPISGGRTPPLAAGQYVKRVSDGAVFQYQGLSYGLAEGQSQSSINGVFKTVIPLNIMPFAHIQFHDFLRRCLKQEFILVTRTETGEFVALSNA